MRRLMLPLVLVALAVPVLTMAQVRVEGYFRSNGTYVEPYTRSAPDTTIKNNYSYPGNYNPYTGQIAPGVPPLYAPPPPVSSPRTR